MSSSTGTTDALRQSIARTRYIFLKELASLFGSNLPPIAVGVVALCCGFVSATIMIAGQQLNDVSEIMFHMFYFMILVTAGFLSMPSFVNERRQGTLELLYTLPVTDTELVLGKFLMGVVSVVTLVVAVNAVYMVGIVGAPWYIVLGGSVGLVVAGLYAYSVGLFASSISDNYVVAILITAFILFLIDVGSFIAGLFPSPAKEIFTHFHLYYHFQPYAHGVIPLKSTVVFLSLLVFFLFATVKVLESRRWRGQ